MIIHQLIFVYFSPSINAFVIFTLNLNHLCIALLMGRCNIVLVENADVTAVYPYS